MKFEKQKNKQTNKQTKQKQKQQQILHLQKRREIFTSFNRGREKKMFGAKWKFPYTLKCQDSFILFRRLMLKTSNWQYMYYKGDWNCHYLSSLKERLISLAIVDICNDCVSFINLNIWSIDVK